MKAEIHEIQNAFVAAAKRALAAGFEWLEMHSAHGYLIHSFFRRSPTGAPTNTAAVSRTASASCWKRSRRPARLAGKTAADRAHFRHGLGRGRLGRRDAVELARRLKAEGVDLIDCSAGGNIAEARIPVGAGYQVPISEAVRRGADIPTATVGLITEPVQADEIIRNDRADVVLLGREMLRDPYWALHAAQALKQPAPVPPQYLRAF